MKSFWTIVPLLGPALAFPMKSPSTAFQHRSSAKEASTSRLRSSRFTRTALASSSDSNVNGVSMMNRRSMLLTTAILAAMPSIASAADATPDDMEVQGFHLPYLPSSWKIITKPNTNTPNKKNSTPTLFSAIDFQSGSVLSVVQERACNVREYAQSTTTCDLVLRDDVAKMFAEETAKDVAKLLIRHDERDNAALQGTSSLIEYIPLPGGGGGVELLARTTIPSGGTYTDTMGLEQLNTIDRKVKAKALVVVEGDTTHILSVWLSAPLDEWNKPVMGTQLNDIWKGVSYQSAS